MIEAGEIAEFNNIMIGTEIEEEHDEIVEEVLRKIAENDSFVKLNIYIYKVKILKVIIEPDGIKIEKKKV